MNKKVLILLIVILLVLVVGYLWSIAQDNQFDDNANLQNSNEVDETVSDWETYTNNQYGFQLSYPSDGLYKPVSDTYGWPNSLILFSGPGGQSYYLAVELWDNEDGFVEEHGEPAFSEVTLQELEGKYISLWNINNDEIVGKIIDTFKRI